MAFISFEDSLNHSWDFLLPGYCFKVFLRETFCPDKSGHVLSILCKTTMTQSCDHSFMSQMLFLNSELVLAGRTLNFFSGVGGWGDYRGVQRRISKP